MKKLLFSFLIVLFLANISFAASFYPATAINGGGTGALDKIDGAGLSNADVAIVVLENDGTYGNALLVYVLDADSGAAESSPSIISPDTNPGTKRWELAGTVQTSTSLSRSATPQINFGDSDTTDSDDNVRIYVNCTDTGSGTEDCDITIAVQIAGTLTDVMIVNADGTITFPNLNIDLTNTVANTLPSASINTIVDSAYWDAGGMTPDGTQCADAARVTINSGPVQYTVICADNDASTLYGHIVMPDSWDGGTVTFEHEYLQTAADTGVLNGDISCQCRGAGETPSSTWGTEVAIDDAAVTGSNAVDHTTSAAATCAGTCAGGDSLWWRYQVDATGTTTAVATLHNLGMKMEFTSNVGD